MQGVGIAGLGVYLPESIMSNEAWSRHVETTDAWITERTGIKRRRIAAPTESTVDLAARAARAALDDARLTSRAIDEIIVATDTPEMRVPDTASFLQHRLEAREIPCYDLAGSGCAGFLQALDLARSRILSESATRVLVIGVELLSRVISWRDRETAVLFGDAGAAAVVSRDPIAEIVATVAGTDGSRAGILGLHTGGTRHPFTPEAAAQGLHDRVTMKGRELFREAVHRMAQAAVQLLAKARCSLEDVALVVPHQANLRIIHAVGRALCLPPDKLMVNIEEYGNTGSASIPLALHEARAAGRIRPGDRVLCTSFGAGLHWAATLLQF